MRRINEDIKNEKFRNLYLLYGDEEYLKQQFKDKLIKALVNEGDTMNFSKYHGKDISDREIIDLAETMPFFAKPVGADGTQYRVILLERCNLASRSATAKKKDEPDLIEYFSALPSHVIFIVLEDAGIGRSKLFKTASSAGLAVEFTMLNDADLAKWIGAKLKSEGKMMKQDAFQLFLKMTHANMSNMDTELEKLISYVGDRDQILSEDVAAICVAGVESKVFDLVNSISEKNLRQTMDIYQKHLALDTNPREILGALIAEFRRMRVIKELYDAGDDYRTIANKMGAKSEYGIKMTIPRAKLMTMSEIDGILNDSAQYLQQINTGLLNDKMAIELLIMKYAGKAS
ncbi:DNA polymerase III subunit delta [Pseudobutyrivibrio sp.]|uniref:DNA polymerase III subunit delta n=1 Tax=Pseudobutyrivibrio sp. TaxID=2014367 RepID=UPI001B501ABE|nr:DNA polymerase III subunit delta [Pseudobutyrivibrio sp.]MBP5597331.1 DNA polymerase III subunit delta [Pseudobutyrivibrio sp.]MBR5650181.1 DNA polymerase III subunit delta [Pseudobutyrivibrio sp.]